MKKTALMAALIIAAAVGFNVPASATTVTLLHNGHLITVNQNAEAAHLAHGDTKMVYYQGDWITEAEYEAIIATPPPVAPPGPPQPAPGPATK